MGDETDDDPVLRAPGVELEREPGCTRGLNWACRFTCPAPALVAQLVAHGVRDASRLPGLADLQLEQRHQLVVVPATGRVQLRLDVEVPRERRPDEALRVAAAVAALLTPPNDELASRPVPQQ